jgi:triacylglycerol lipase
MWSSAHSGVASGDPSIGVGRSLASVRWSLIAAAVLLLGALAAGWLVHRRRLAARRRRAPGVGLRHPVVLVHGICGFDEISLFGWKRRYFAGIGQHLERLGVTVYHARVPAFGSVPERAAQLVQFVRSLPAERVSVIAHSMGGLDARYAIAKLGGADRIASLVTIGTPHHGTPLADLGQVQPALIARGLIKRLGLPSDSLDWLTPARMASFNAEIADDPRVVYASVVCRAGGAAPWTRNPLLRVSHAYLKRRAGTNDGVVPASSQMWGRRLCEIQAHHWAQIGWFTVDDARPLYAMIVEHLAGQGL